MASQAYNSWTAAVIKAGGRVVQSSVSGDSVPHVLSAAYPASVWVPKVNAKNPATGVSFWPLPDEYSTNGQTGYYHAPLVLQNEAQSFSVATTGEQKAGATQLMNQWGIPEWLRSPSAFLTKFGSSAIMIAIALGVVYIVVNRRKR